MNARSIGSAAWQETQALLSTSPGVRQALRPFVYAVLIWSGVQVASGRDRQYTAGTGALACFGELRYAKMAAILESGMRAVLKARIRMGLDLPWAVSLGCVLILSLRTMSVISA